MTLFEATILGIVQGLTEFIPVSSSGHLVLLHEAFAITENGLAFDVALHIGTLLALVIFFYKDLWQLFRALWRKGDSTHLAWLLVLATIPAVIVGYLLQDTAETTFRSIRLVATNLILVGIIMLWAERLAARRKNKTQLGRTKAAQALTMGIAQAAAIVPGVSRSGSTITAGLFAGLTRQAATRFSFLLAVPITAGAALKVLLESTARQDISQHTDIFIVGILAAFISGLFAIKFMLGFVAKHSLASFAYYRFVVGGIVLIAAWLG